MRQSDRTRELVRQARMVALNEMRHADHEERNTQILLLADEVERLERVALTPEPGHLTILQVGMVEGTMCALVDCTDHDIFQALPQVVSYQGTLLGKTGWNSDTHRAHYQSNALVLKVR